MGIASILFHMFSVLALLDKKENGDVFSATIGITIKNHLLIFISRLYTDIVPVSSNASILHVLKIDSSNCCRYHCYMTF